MAKSFKQAAAGSATPRPATGPDLLDWLTTKPTGEQADPSTPAPEPAPTLPDALIQLVQVTAPPFLLPSTPATVPEPVSLKAKSTAVKRKPRPAGNTPLLDLPAALAPAQPASGLATNPVPPAKTQLLMLGRDTRQTFVVNEIHVEQLRDYVHSRRVAGEYDFSQKQALAEAISEYLAARQSAPPRPEAVRAREQQFRHRIREGRQSKKPGDADKE